MHQPAKIFVYKNICLYLHGRDALFISIALMTRTGHLDWLWVCSLINGQFEGVTLI